MIHRQQIYSKTCQKTSPDRQQYDSFINPFCTKSLGAAPWRVDQSGTFALLRRLFLWNFSAGHDNFVQVMLKDLWIGELPFNHGRYPTLFSLLIAIVNFGSMEPEIRGGWAHKSPILSHESKDSNDFWTIFNHNHTLAAKIWIICANLNTYILRTNLVVL